MTTNDKTDIVKGAVLKKWWRSTTFLATLATELILLVAFFLVLWFDIDEGVTQKVLSALVFAMGFVALAFIAPKIAHDAVTRLPAVKGLYGNVEAPPGKEAPDEPPPQG